MFLSSSNSQVGKKSSLKLIISIYVKSKIYKYILGIFIYN